MKKIIIINLLKNRCLACARARASRAGHDTRAREVTISLTGKKKSQK